MNGSTATIYSIRALTQPAGYWNGAIIHMEPGEQWEAQTGTVISSAPGQVTFSFTPGNEYELPAKGTSYFLTNSFKSLNSSGEWYRDPTSGKLYLWTPGSDNPSSHDIEVKRRDYAFDLTGTSNITIQGVNIFAATILTESQSTGTVLNHLNASYISQFVILLAREGQEPTDSRASCSTGANSLLENSTIQFSPGDGVYVTGVGSRVTNNVIHDVDYSGGDSAGIRILGKNVEIDHNTVFNSGRDGIKHSATGLQILNNTIHDYGLQTTDAGAIYTVRTNGGGSVIAYNTAYNAHSGGYGMTGLYIDNKFLELHHPRQHHL